ncbi:MAG: acyltransferase [Acutalibacteraceae bacterium]
MNNTNTVAAAPEKHVPRDIRYDLIRVTAMCMVLGIHTVNRVEGFAAPFNTTWYVKTLFSCIFMICNPLFFMLSGKFALKKKFETAKDYRDFYFKKLITIVIPLLIFSVLAYLINFKTDFPEPGIGDFFRRFMGCQIQPVYWFMYTLIGIMLFSPFYSAMLQNMSVRSKRIFFWMLFAANGFVTVMLLAGIGILGGYTAFGIISYHTYYFLGYIAEDIFPDEKSRRTVILFGALAFVIQLLIAIFEAKTGGTVNIYDPSPWITFETLALYFLLLKVKVKDNLFGRSVGFTAQFSFIFYLVHIDVLRRVAENFDLVSSSFKNALLFLPIYLITFVITLIISVAFEYLLMKPLQKFLLKLLRLG